MADLSSGPLSVSPLPDSDADACSSVELLTRAQNGDEEARNELCARYLPRLRRWAHGRLPIWAREHLDTEDIVQDTLLRAWRNPSVLDQTGGSARAWLFTVARRIVIDQSRSASRRR